MSSRLCSYAAGTVQLINVIDKFILSILSIAVLYFEGAFKISFSRVDYCNEPTRFFTVKLSGQHLAKDFLVRLNSDDGDRHNR